MVQNPRAGNQVQELDTATLLEYCGFSVEASRNIIIAEIMPNGCDDLVGRNIKTLQTSCQGFSTRAQDPFVVTDHQLSNLIGLVYRASRNSKVNLKTGFPTNTSKAQVLQAIRVATQWYDGYKERVTRGNQWLTKTLDTKLDTQLQWKHWAIDLDRRLSLIIGEKGIPLSYVIRKDAAIRDKEPNGTFQERAYHVAKLNDDDFKADAQVVHNIILDNLVDKGAAHGYIISVLPYKDGRKDIEALRRRFEAEGVVESLHLKARKGDFCFYGVSLPNISRPQSHHQR